MYQVLARKCRPQTFDTLVGQKHVTRTLANAIESDRLAHAYIFAGLRGTGKTTVARILAKCLNCEKGPTIEPCLKCAACVEIGESQAIDVLELDAASRTSVDNIRELQEVVSYAPARDRFKILIIDEAHMLSKAAFNALLKTLEEPPPNVIFVLATTEIQKVLPTILSRCQVFEFRRVPPTEVAAYLRRICDTEKITISDAAVERIARAGEGSIRDSLSVLEQVLAFCGEGIDDDDVLRILGGVRSEVLVDMVGALARRDAEAMLTIFDGLVDEGHDLLHFWNEWIAALRDVLLMRSMQKRTPVLTRSENEAKELEQAAADLSVEDLNRAFQILADLEPALRSSSQPRFLFESALIRLAGLGSVRPIEDVLRELGGSTAAAPKKPAPAKGQKKKPAPVSDERAAAPPADDLKSRLAAALGTRPMVAAIVEQVRSVIADGEHLILSFDEEQKSVVGPLQHKGGLEQLDRAARKILGRPVRTKIEVGAQATGPPSATEAPARETAPAEATTGDALIERARSEPGVRRLLREFGAQVVDIRPNKPDREH